MNKQWTVDLGALLEAIIRAFVGRSPNPRALKNRVTRIVRGKQSISEVIEEIARADPARKAAFQRVWSQRNTIWKLNTSADQETLDELFEKTAIYWRSAGQDPSEVFFSVLTSPEFRTTLSKSETSRFYASGIELFSQYATLIANHSDRPLSELKAMDFGCGVGRLTFPAGHRFGEVLALDFSEGHLQVLRDHVPQAIAHKLRCSLVSSLDDFDCLESVDVVFSHITLQHNTPPVMAYIIRRLLRALNPGGVALLHIPIHHPFYEFDIQDYLESETTGDRMEMHMLPRENLRDIAEESGSKIADSYGLGGTKGIYSEVFAFVKI